MERIATNFKLECTATSDVPVFSVLSYPQTVKCREQIRARMGTVKKNVNDEPQNYFTAHTRCTRCADSGIYHEQTIHNVFTNSLTRSRSGVICRHCHKASDVHSLCYHAITFRVVQKSL